MPDKAQHLKKAMRNEEFRVFVAADGLYSEWVVVALFYSALHYVDALLAATHNKHPKDHQKRQDFVKLFVLPIWSEYRQLESVSREARYECNEMSEDDVKRAKDWRDTIQKHVEQQLAAGA